MKCRFRSGLEVSRNVFFLVIFFLTLGAGSIRAAVDPAQMAWQELKGKHFIIFFQSPTERSVAEYLLRKAEGYYSSIGDQIGYTRYGDFWTWEERAKIYLFPDQKIFLEATGSPSWSLGYSDKQYEPRVSARGSIAGLARGPDHGQVAPDRASLDRDSYVFRSRFLVTYQQESNFFDGLLPHEISHLILHDFIPAVNLPIWFDEGVAQLQERHKSQEAGMIMRKLVPQKRHIAFRALANRDIRQEKDQDQVIIFYAQSLSVVEFLARTHGSDAFTRLCRGLRDGKNFEESLKTATHGQISSFEEMEQKWIQYLSQTH